MLSFHLRTSITKFNSISGLLTTGTLPAIRNLRKTTANLQTQCTSGVVPCNIVKINEHHYRFNIEAKAIVQFDDVPLHPDYEIPPLNGPELNAKWLNDPSCSNKELIERLIFVSNYCKENEQEITSTEFDAFVDNFTARLANFTENELLAALQVFSRMPQPDKKGYTLNDRNFAELWMALDDSCGHWSQRYPIDQLMHKLLLFCDIWKEISVRQRSKFAQAACRKIFKRAKMLGPAQYVQGILFTLKIGKYLYTENKTLFIKDLDRLLDDLSVNDMGILCGSLAKENSFRLTKTDLIHRIIAKVDQEKNFDAFDGRSFFYTLSVIRDSIRLEHKVPLAQLMRTLSAQIPLLSPKNADNISTLGERINLFDDACIEALIKKVISNIDEFTLADMQQTAYTLYKVRPDFERAHEALSIILNELPKRLTEIGDAPRRFVSLVHCLSLFGLYNEELIHNVLRKDLRDAIYPHFKMYPPEIFALDAFTRINLRGKYQGAQLEEKAQKAVVKVAMAYIPVKNGTFKIRGTDTLLTQIEDVVRDAYKYYNYGHALPHTGYADIYLIYDKDKREFIDYRNEFPEPYSGTIMWKNDLLKGRSNLEAIALVGSYFKNHCDQTNIRNTLHQAKFDQLAILGYKAVDVCFPEWKNLTAEERRIYIEDKINKILADL